MREREKGNVLVADVYDAFFTTLPGFRQIRERMKGARFDRVSAVFPRLGADKKREAS